MSGENSVDSSSGGDLPVSHEFYNLEVETEQPITPTGSNTAPDQLKLECVVCQVEVCLPEAVKLSCGHVLCFEDVNRYFSTANRTERIFPPRCCEVPIPLEIVAPLLDKDTLEEFQEREIEYSTEDRVYCFNPQCFAFIPPSDICDYKATCSKCSKTTCVLCRKEYHDDLCVLDASEVEFESYVAQQGFQKCGHCGSIVELAIGCNHIT